ncbi:DUF6415 family natural product biosynthesis protein [Streptomyces sp. NBC_01216]|uniref:DUF6415 family natural product biosynthesis protein n=1 Tax=Streptomyces sp. NBC_01216 TaxID=2903778 RepID=UPI002E0EF29E|nr:DUF6415 family natural product biosynthesis protein [Streptomyces sp. NBC_01216]
MTKTALRDETTSPETMPVRVKDPTVEAEPWTPPLGRLGLHDLLSAVRNWEPVDWDAVYDGLDIVLNEEVSHHAAGSSGSGRPGAAGPGYDEAEELAQRFRGALMQLVNRGLRDDANKHPDVADLIERARTLRSEELPGDEQQALTFLRKLGRVTLELAERLEEVGIVKGLVEC